MMNSEPFIDLPEDKASRHGRGVTFISLPALAAKLGISRQRVYALAADGRIRTEKVAGGVSAVHPDEVKRVMAAAVKTLTSNGRRIVRFSTKL